jgi:L-threonylcarbamoyladenylate synthase
MSPNLDLSKAVDILRQNGVVAVPSETVYGLAANAYSQQACERIFKIKGRPLYDPLIVHIPKSWISLERLNQQGIVDLASLSQRQKEILGLLMAQFWPGPLSILLPKGPRLASIVTSGLDTVALRCPSHPIFQHILEELHLPLAAPSANRFGRISPTRAEDVFEELGEKLDGIVDGGACEVGVESTIVSIEASSLKILRQGKIGQQELSALIQSSGIHGFKVETTLAKLDEHVIAPGMLASHYAPQTPVTLFDSGTAQSIIENSRGIDFGMILFDSRVYESSVIAFDKLIPLGNDPSNAAKNLYRAMRALDRDDVARIYVEFPGGDGDLWDAIRDRLRRAASRESKA